MTEGADGPVRPVRPPDVPVPEEAADDVSQVLGGAPARRGGLQAGLERIHRRLGVATRTAAAVQALSIAGALPPAPG